MLLVSEQPLLGNRLCFQEVILNLVSEENHLPIQPLMGLGLGLGKVRVTLAL